MAGAAEADSCSPGDSIVSNLSVLAKKFRNRDVQRWYVRRSDIITRYRDLSVIPDSFLIHSRFIPDSGSRLHAPWMAMGYPELASPIGQTASDLFQGEGRP